MTGTTTSSQPRIDIVALGTNDQLRHRVLQGAEPISDWEDIGVFGNSAPLLINLTSSNVQPERVAMFVMGTDGQVNQTVWDVVPSELSWKNLVWTSMGGNLSTEFYLN